MKQAITGILLTMCCSITGYCVLPVVDYTAIAQAAGNHVVDFAKWAESEIQQAETQINTLDTLEQQILQVERMGDPKTLTANIPGVSSIQNLGEMYYQAQQDVSDWSAYVNPQSYKITADQVLGIYGQPAMTEFTALNGMRVGSAQSLVQFQTSNYNVAKGAQQTVTKLTEQLKTLTKQLASATSAMQSATTQSEVQKYQAVISGLHASIDATNGALQQAKFQAQLQTDQNNYAQQITRQAQAQSIQASDYQAIDQGLRGLPVGQMNRQILWNAQP